MFRDIGILISCYIIYVSPDFQVVTFFTPQEANEILPRVKKLLNDIIRKKTEADALKDELEEIMKKNLRRREYDNCRRRIEIGTLELAGLVRQLEVLGCELKNLEQGLVDFPAVRIGQEVNLCWKIGENSVEYWHGVYEGFMGRKLVRTDEFYDKRTTYHATV